MFAGYRIASLLMASVPVNSENDPCQCAPASGEWNPDKSFLPSKEKSKNQRKNLFIRFFNRSDSQTNTGVDFLQVFGMVIDLRNRQLWHAGLSTGFSSASEDISGVNLVQSSPFAHILREFPEVTDTSLASRTSRHGVECFIDTTGPPVRTAPWRLMLEKLRTAKKYFDLMCAAGICRRLNSPWS